MDLFPVLSPSTKGDIKKIKIRMKDRKDSSTSLRYKPTAMHIRLQEGKPLIPVLIDTGAGLSLVDSSLVSHLKQTPDHIPLRGLGQSVTIGRVTLSIEVPALHVIEPVTLVFEHEFHVVNDLAPRVVLGSDFIFGHEVLIDGKHHRATYDDKYTWKIWPVHKTPRPDTGDHVWTIKSTPTWPVTLQACKDIVVPARHHAWVPVRPSRTLPKGPFSVSPSFWEDACNDCTLMVPASVTDSDNLYVLVTNIGNSDGVIPSNMPITQAHPLLEAVETEQVFVLDAIPRPEILTVSPAEPEGAIPFTAKDADVDNESKEELVAETTTLIDNVFNVGSSATPEILRVLRDNLKVFSTDGKPGHVTGFPLAIPLKKDSTLRPLPPRRTSPEKRDIIEKTVEQLLASEVIEPSSSPTSYPVLLVRQGPKWRMCIDYRDLNLATVDDKYPLPRMEDIFECLSKGRVFSSVDAVSGYFQLDVKEDDKWKTAFTCHKGLYQFRRIPFGLKNAPSHFQRFMDLLLGSMRWQSAMVYLDDAVIFSSTVAEHAKHLSDFFARCSSFGLKLSPKKCFFAVSSLNLLGRLVTVDGISIIPDRAEAIKKLATPRSLHDVFRLLGLFNYYRPFIPNFAQLAAPLTAKTKGVKYKKNGTDYSLELDDKEYRNSKSVPVQCNDTDIKAIDALKAALCHQVTLAYPDRDKEWFLYVDASKEGYAVALHQQYERPLRPKESSLLGTEKTLEDSDFVDINLVALADLPQDFPEASQIAQMQKEDPVWNPTIRSFAEGEPKKGYALVENVLVRTNNDTICIPQGMLDDALDWAHAGHPGSERTYMKMSSRFHHPSLIEKVNSWVKYCPTCIRTKIVKRVGRLDLDDDDFLGLPFHTVSIDLMLGLPGPPKDACLIIVDVFSKMVLLHPMTSQATATEIAIAFEHLVLRRGWKPSRIISDNDLRFVGQVASTIAERLRINLTPSAPYHQAANPVERYVQEVKKTLTATLLDSSPQSWPDMVPSVELSINSTPSTVTKYAPFDLVYVYRSNLLGHLLEHSGVGSIHERMHFSKVRVQQAVEALKEARLKQKKRYDARRLPLPEYKPNDLVMVRLKDRPLNAGRELQTALDPPLEGPFKVLEALSDHRIKLALPPDMKVDPIFDVSQLKPVPTGDPYNRPGLVVEEGGDALYEPLRIVKERMLGTHRQYYVRWSGSSRMTWEFEQDLLEQGCQDLIAEWQEQPWGTPPLPAAFSIDTVDASDAKTSRPLPQFPSAKEANTLRSVPSRRAQTRIIDGVTHLVQERPVAFSSRETTPGEKKLVAIELEASALVWAYLKLLPLFEGCPVHIITDHSPLTQIFKGPSDRLWSNALIKARNRLAPYCHLLTFHHRSGNLHTNADSLSRLKTSP